MCYDASYRRFAKSQCAAYCDLCELQTYLYVCACGGVRVCVRYPAIAERTKTLALRYIHDDDHFINDCLSLCPSGRYRTVKYIEQCGEEIVSYAI